jgi:hypothetical protein
MLFRIAHILRKLFNLHGVDRPNCFHDKTEVSNSDQLFVGCLGDHDARDEHFFSLFQVL